MLSPLSGKTTIVMAESLSALGMFGVDMGKKVRNEFGGLLKTRWEQKVAKNVTLP